MLRRILLGMRGDTGREDAAPTINGTRALAARTMRTLKMLSNRDEVKDVQATLGNAMATALEAATNDSGFMQQLIVR